MVLQRLGGRQLLALLGLLTAGLFLLGFGNGSWLKGCGTARTGLLPPMLAGMGSHTTALQRRLSLPPPPWRPLLRPPELRRGLAFYGSGQRIERVAAKLLAGEPIKAFTIGGSVTRGSGASSQSTSYPARFFEFINTTFPHRDHVLQNKGIGASTSGIFSVCAESLIPPDADLVVVEFTFNEPAEQPFSSPQRRGFEQLLRKLARLPGRPAVVVLHHYAWWFCHGDGAEGGLYYRATELHFGTLAQYYDMPSPSVRSAVWPLMRAGVPPFKVTHVLRKGKQQVSPAGVKLPLAEPGTEGDYFFYDKVHPSDVGHQVMAELLAGVVLQAVDRSLAAEEAAVRAQAMAGGAAAGAAEGAGVVSVGAAAGAAGEQEAEEAAAGAGAEEGRAAAAAAGATGLSGWAGGGSTGSAGTKGEDELLPPMIPGNADVPTTFCAMQEDFRPYGKRMKGFKWRAERPDAPTPVEQKWGYSATAPGDWIELELSTLDGSGAGANGTAAPGGGEQQAAAGGKDRVTVFVGYLSSYEGTGLARAECVSGCACKPTTFDARWKQRVSLTSMHRIQATQHAQCRIRITILERPPDQAAAAGKPGGKAVKPGGKDGGSKVQLNALMAAQFPVVLDNRIAKEAGGLLERDS